jgi:hypothetical protein
VGAVTVGALAGLAAYAAVRVLPGLSVRTGRGSRQRLAGRTERTVLEHLANHAAPDPEPETRVPAVPRVVEPEARVPAVPRVVEPKARVPAVPRVVEPLPAVPRVDSGLVSAATSPVPAARWQPEHIHVGRTVSTRYLGPDSRFHRTWLVFDGEEHLVGGAGMRARRPGGEAECLEVWLFDRDESAVSADPPIVALATPRASDREGSAGRGDGVIEVIGGRQDAEIPMVATVAGVRFSLVTDALVLRGVVVEALVDASGLAFRTLTLDLCATRKQSAEA